MMQSLHGSLAFPKSRHKVKLEETVEIPASFKDDSGLKLGHGRDREWKVSRKISDFCH